MQNSLNKERNIVEFASSTKLATDVMKGSGVSPMSKFNELPKTAQITPIKAKCVYTYTLYVVQIGFSPYLSRTD